MKEITKKEFKNGVVYLLKTDDGYLVETTDTFLPYYTKDAIGRKQNCLSNDDVGSRAERWMVGVSVMSGCPIRCKFCATGQMKKWRNLTAQEIVDQVLFVLKKNDEDKPFAHLQPKEFKINYTRMGEPFLNIEAVKEAIRILDTIPTGDIKIHHYISTIGIQGTDFSWVKDNITLQISLHSLDEERRKWLIPFPKLMSMKEMGQIRTGSDLKTTLNMTLVDEKDFDIEKLKANFDPNNFFIKLSPINSNVISKKNDLGNGVIEGTNIV
jgi:adenine C2-methylase RlmN of 23S rRNA A2503 and tRNA A37